MTLNPGDCGYADLGATATTLLSRHGGDRALARRLVASAGELQWLWRADVLAGDVETELRRAGTRYTSQLAELIEEAGATVPPPDPEPPPPGRASAALIQWERENAA